MVHDNNPANHFILKILIQTFSLLYGKFACPTKTGNDSCRNRKDI